MHIKITELCEALDSLSDAIDKVGRDKDLSAKFLNKKLGGILPHVVSGDLSNIPMVLKERLELSDFENLDDGLISTVEGVIYQIESLEEDVTPLLLNAASSIVNQNADANTILHPIYSFIATMTTIEYLLEPILGWQHLDSKLVPRSLRSNLKKIEMEIDRITPDYNVLKEKITQIEQASQVSNRLPETLIDLDDAYKELNKHISSAENLKNQIISFEADARIKHQEIFSLNENATNRINDVFSDAQKMINEAEKALSASTSVALAQSFRTQADVLKKSVRSWTWALAISLCIILCVVLIRMQSLSPFLGLLMKQNSTPWAALFIQLSITFFLLFPPIWLAWVATKQIRQCFQLEQDYVFKAATATAYQGYHREAANLNDIEIQKRLFKAALTRLEEPPTRWLETDNHGSPMDGVIDSLGRANPFKNSQTQNKSIRDNSNTQEADKVNVTNNKVIQEEEEEAAV